ncbi:MAG: class I SAM-dependent methyltransferase [Candidatus Rickettsiella isopodorum]|jgi:isonocardicin synthase|nr:class I SAM-dependent methyltransferase [Gammaproteobacteria bacterium]
MEEIQVAKNIDIWYEASQIKPEIYVREKAIQAFHLQQMQLKALHNETIASVFEAWEDQPIRFFFFAIGSQTYCGRKLLSDIVTCHGSPGFFCSLVKIEMLLGELIRSQVSQEGVELFYKPLSFTKRCQIFEQLKNHREIDIYYPFVHLSKVERLEINTPEQGWFITKERAHLLSLGERYLRKISADLVKSGGNKKPIIYDPACSTGEFLSVIKQAVPESIVIGQDISPQMCEWAASKLDQVICGNSMNPGVTTASCDYIFFRFLNAEVVSTQLAKQLFIKIICCLKPNGLAILFGHTPVLLAVSFMEHLGFQMKSCNYYIESEMAVVQYYVIKPRSKGEYDSLC